MTNEELLTKIRVEIESRIKELHEAEIDYREDQCDTIVSCLVSGISELQRVLTILNTLEKSLPTKVKDNKELEMEIERVVTEYKEKVFGTKVMKPSGVEKIARSFYDLGCRRTAEKYDEIEYNRQRAEENVPNDLEEAANRFAIFYDQGTCDGIAQDCFIAGAKWQKEHDAELIEIAYNDGITIGMTKQKEQMMKEAVEGEIRGDIRSQEEKPYQIWAESDFLPLNREFKIGDKVRIIIVKED